MTAKTELDAIDRRILRILAQDGRASYQAVADEIGLSRPAIMERVKRLEESGYIQGYRVQLDRAKVGLPVTAFVTVRYGSSDYVGDEPRMREMEKHPGVLECHHIAGDDCYILKVVAHDLEGVQAILRDLRGPNSQMNTRTTIVLSTLFEKPGFIPAEPD
ncbi:MAG TPA: Lrp/AsnC family transcriptional regulator [Gemmatimonadales bacterium]